MKVRTGSSLPADLDAVITTDGAWLGVSWVGFTQHDTASFNHVQTFPDHADNRARCHILDQTREEFAL